MALASVRTRQFAQATFNTAGDHLLYAVPPGARALIKWCSVLSTVAAPGDLTIYTIGSGGGVQALLHQTAAASLTLYSAQELYAVLEEDEELHVGIGSVTGGGVIFVGAGGILFD